MNTQKLQISERSRGNESFAAALFTVVSLHKLRPLNSTPDSGSDVQDPPLGEECL